MSLRIATPWHKASYDRFLNERLPELLAERLPLAGYRVDPEAEGSCRLTVTLAGRGNEVELAFDGIPLPDDQGVFTIGGERRVVVPVATEEDLAQAEIRCVGELLYAVIAARLGQAPPELPWDVRLARAWLPLDSWITAFVSGEDASTVTSQSPDQTNWLAHHTHLRRLVVPRGESVIHPSELGRVCPFETPDGPNMGRVLTLAVGAGIRDGKVVGVDERPEARLGLSASMIPFIEHDDPNRILMGANMLRQWVPQARSEPALVQTGNEPEGGPFWHGRNLLTVFVAWGPGTYEDGIVVSASCADRFDTPTPLRIGDKMSNRHGSMGVVSQILPDDNMPHLDDGTPVDLVFNFASLHSRMAFGPVREAVMGRIAHREGEPVVVPPFAAPGAAELQQRLVEAGLPSSGMETLMLGRAGPPLDQPSTLGYVYWGRLMHLAQDKLHTFTEGEWGQVQGEMEAYMLRDLGAFETIREGLNTRAVRNPDSDTLSSRLGAGAVALAEPPTPLFRDLARRLRVAGIEATLKETGVTFRFTGNEAGDRLLKLAHPLPHPWLRERELTAIGAPARDTGGEWDDLWALLAPPGGWYGPATLPPAYADVVEANSRAARMLAAQAPSKLVEDAVAQLADRVQTFFDMLLTPVQLRISERVLFSARAVLVPATGITLEQVGLPDAMAWALFGPLAARELDGDQKAVAGRDNRAAAALDAVMARSWVIVNRAPTVMPTALLAFRPKRVDGDALHIHPLVCEWLNADFDGDQAAVHLPVTETAQREASEKPSVAAHLRRDPSLLKSLLPNLDALWGLAALSREPGGLEEVSRLAGAPVSASRGFVTRDTLAEALHDVLLREGAEAVLARVEQLAARGFEVAKASGASLSPFIDSTALISPAPPDAEPRVGDADVALNTAWDRYVAEVVESLAAPVDCAPAHLEPQCLMARASGRGFEQLAWLLAGRGRVEDAGDTPALVRHGYAEGYTAEELFACVAGAREGLAQVIRQWEELGRSFRSQHVAPSFHVLARALRTKNPGVVFARAAAVGEVDPLIDVEARLLVGLPVK